MSTLLGFRSLRIRDLARVGQVMCLPHLFPSLLVPDFFFVSSRVVGMPCRSLSAGNCLLKVAEGESNEACLCAEPGALSHTISRDRSPLVSLRSGSKKVSTTEKICAPISELQCLNLQIPLIEFVHID